MRFSNIWVLIALTFGCTDPEVFAIQPIPAQRALVGEELQVELVLVDLGGSVPTFSMTAPTLPNLMSRPNPPRVTVFGDRGAYLRWSPIASDLGIHEMTVTARGADHSTSRSFMVEVVSGDAAPIFLKPLGAGMTLDLSRENCFRFGVEVQDTDTVSGVIRLEAPLEDGYRLVPSGDWLAEFEWCPTDQQINLQTRYPLNLVADDGDGHITRKSYSLIIRDAIGDNCEGRAPRIEHSSPGTLPREASIQLSARITDDIGIESAPTVYYRAYTGDNFTARDLTTFVNGTMELRTGIPTDGLYGASIPLSFLPAGVDSVEYFVEVTDNDDPIGNCDHRTTSPSDGLHRVDLEIVPTTAMKGACDPCAADGECASGFCAVQPDNTGVCLQRCSDDIATNSICDTIPRGACCGETLVECNPQAVNNLPIQVPCNGPCGWDVNIGHYDCEPTHPADPSGQYPNECPMSSACAAGYACSGIAQVSMSGQSSTVCAPDGGSCSILCADDRFEPNDTVFDAYLLESGTVELTELKLCGNEVGGTYDYYNVYLPTKGQVSIEARFAHNEGDLDLSLRDAQDQIVEFALSITDNERISACIEPGTYTINALSFSPLVDINYSLSVDFQMSDCCQADPYEPNDSANTAALIFAGPIQPLLSICRDDLDYYAIDLMAGDTLVVDLLFDQATEDQDLDVFIHDAADGRLTPCCQLENGQSVTADEHLEYAISVSGRYHIVVEGYAGARNDYMMSVDVR